MSIKSSVRKIYVRPIMKAKRLWNGSVDEYIPDEYVFPTATLEAVEKISIAVAGREISAGEGNSISVYDVSGKLVVKGLEKVTVPESGVYAVSVNNGRAQKIVIK